MAVAGPSIQIFATRDLLIGGDWHDTLHGNCRMTGGTGDELFQFSAGNKVITDFNRTNGERDRVDFRPFFTALTQVEKSAEVGLFDGVALLTRIEPTTSSFSARQGA